MFHVIKNRNSSVASCLTPEPKELRVDESFMYPEILNAEMVFATNQQRVRHGLTTLVFSKGLQRIATIHSRQMKIHNFFDHDNPYDNRLRTLLDRIHAAKDPQLESFTFFGENISRRPMLKAGITYSVLLKDGRPHFITDNGEILPYTCTELAQSAVDGWMRYPGHRANILNPKFGFIGCGCSRILERRQGYTMVHYLLTQDFGGRMPFSR